MNGNVDKYYPCLICGWNSPKNKILEKNGETIAYCSIHYETYVVNEKNDTKLVKRRDEEKQDFRKAFVDIDKTAIGDITV